MGRYLVPNTAVTTFVAAKDTVEASNSRYGKDKNNVYENGNILEGADSKTFDVPE